MAMTIETVGILHPGAMGISVAVSMKDTGYDVVWASEGRSEASKGRAEEHNLLDIETIKAMCDEADVIVSVCPPHAAEDVADYVVANGFSGLFVDANAISPQKALRIVEKLQNANVDFVDGGIIGGPAWKAGRTWLYLSGERGEEVAQLFADGKLETDVIGDDAGKASALKMCYAANTKGSTALLSLVMSAAEKLGVRTDLESQWDRQSDTMTEQNRNRVQRVTQKAWRFAGEMDEMVETFGSIGLPSGFHESAGNLYRRMAHFKDSDPLPELMDVLMALLNEHND